MAYKAHRDGDDVVIRVPMKDAAEFFDFTGHGAKWDPKEKEPTVGQVAKDLYFAMLGALDREDAVYLTSATPTMPTEIRDGIVRWGRIK